MDAFGYFVQVVRVPSEEGNGKITVGRRGEDSSYAGALFSISSGP